MGEYVDTDLFEEELHKRLVMKAYSSICRELISGIFTKYDNKAKRSEIIANLATLNYSYFDHKYLEKKFIEELK
jgi:hypothetical protein